MFAQTVGFMKSRAGTERSEYMHARNKIKTPAAAADGGEAGETRW